MSQPETAAPTERFNFARHLIALNAGRPDKTALIDDAGSLTYGQLADQVQRCSAALTALGLRREDRVLLLMHDCSDWVVSFLGALHAGVVPVCVNTLLTAKDYAYMLADSRARGLPLAAAFKQARVFGPQQRAFEAALGRLGRPALLAAVQHAARADRIVKGLLRGNIGDELERLALRLMP